MSRLYYIYPFGQNADDLTAIPSPAAVDGSVSYYAGWTDPYEYDLLTTPAALPIPRGQMNQLFYDITNNIQQYQQYGVPAWITATDNGGVSFPYPIYARAYYLGQVYENQVASNTATPGTDDTWLLLSGNAQGVPIGTVIDFAGIIAPTGYLTCDGSAISRTTYLDLREEITFSETGTTTNLMNTISGLSDTSNMYIGMPIEGTNIPLATIVASIVDANNITISNNATASGSGALVFFPWGNGDNATTFNLPDLRRKTTIGKFGFGSALVGNKVGQTGGSETQTLVQNQLPSTLSLNSPTTTLTNLPNDGGQTLIGISGSGNTTQVFTNVGGGGQAVSIMQPTAVMNKCIKY